MEVSNKILVGYKETVKRTYDDGETYRPMRDYPNYLVSRNGKIKLRGATYALSERRSFNRDSPLDKPIRTTRIFKDGKAVVVIGIEEARKVF